MGCPGVRNLVMKSSRSERAYTIREIADALGLNPSSVKRRAAREEWPFEEATGRGGKRRLFPLESLPAEVQKALLIAYPGSDETEPTDPAPEADRPAAFDYDREALWEHYSRKPDKQKERARQKHRWMLQVMRLVDAGHPWQEAFQTVATIDGSVSWRTLRDIYHGKSGRPGLKHYDRADWLAALVPGYVGRTAKADLSPEAWEYIKADYLRLEKPTLTACYDRLCRAAEAHGWSVPSLKTVERRIRELPLTLRVLRREGEHALLRLFPALERTVRDLHALEWINGDGYEHNVFVKWPDGTIGRPKTWFWQDVYSRRFLAYRTDETEHTDVIRLSFGEVVERYGIPDHVTIDNTRAAANKWMTGGVPNRYRFKVKEEDPIGLFPMLGVQVHWTSVQAGKGHGQAKPVERAFGVGGIGDRIDKHPALAGAYTGANPMAKPENYASRAVPIEEFMKVLAEEVKAWNALPKRRTEICGGVLSFDDAFERSYSRAAIRTATAEQRRLWMLAAEAVPVKKDGSVVLDAGGAVGFGRNRYGDDALLEFIGHKVVVRFDPDRLHESVHIYTLDGRYITEAECISAAGFGDTQRGRQHNRARKQKLRAIKELARAEQRMDALEASTYLPEVKTPDDAEPGAVRLDFRNRKKVAVNTDLERPSDDEDLLQGFDDLMLAMASQHKDGGIL